MYTENGSSPSGANAGSRTMSRWNGSTVGRPATSNSSSARRARSSASSRVAPVTMSFASSESKAPEISSPVVTPESTRTPGPPGNAQHVHRAGRGQEVAARVLAVDAELDRVARGDRVGVVEHAALGEAELLAHEVDAGDLLGDRVLDLQPGVHLEERDGAVLADEELARAGADVADLARGSPSTTRRAAAFCSSVRNGAGASSTSFWWRRCSEQSRVETTTTLPCWSARHWVSTWRGLVEVLLDEALAAAERRDRLAGGRVEELGHLLARAGDLEAAAAAAEGGLDRDGQAVHVDELEHLGGIRHRVQRARRRAARRPSRRRAGRETLSPRRSMASGDGPIQMRPASMTARAKSAFSARKP